MLRRYCVYLHPESGVGLSSMDLQDADALRRRIVRNTVDAELCDLWLRVLGLTPCDPLYDAWAPNKDGIHPASIELHADESCGKSLFPS